MNKVIIDGSSLTLNDLVNVSRNHFTVELAEDAKLKVKKARKLVDSLVASEKVQYGITTGFGKI